MPFTFSITNGIFAGAALFLVLRVLKGEWIFRFLPGQHELNEDEEDETSLFEPLMQVPPYPH
jgi:hypothetical protein